MWIFYVQPISFMQFVVYRAFRFLLVTLFMRGFSPLSVFPVYKCPSHLSVSASFGILLLLYPMSVMLLWVWLFTCTTVVLLQVAAVGGGLVAGVVDSDLMVW